jgi:pseudaminic acid cytidylyltransferase
VARVHGAEVPFTRPAELANDHAGTVPVIAHATRWLQGEHRDLTHVCCVYATAPFVRAQDLARALELLDSADWQFVFPATTFAFPIFRAFENEAAGGLRMFFPEHFNTRSQDLPEALHDAGQFYWGTPAAWLSGAAIFGPKSTCIRIERWRVQDIDTEEDWRRAEIAWQVMGS